MDFLEKDLEDILYESDQAAIRKRGMPNFKYSSIFRQVRLGAYGIADLITYSKGEKGQHLIKVYELKNKVLNAAAFWQTVRYVKAIKHFWAKNINATETTVLGVMIGRTVDLSGELCYLPTINSDIFMYTYDYALEGISFKKVEDIYSLNSPGTVTLQQFDCESSTEFFRKLLFMPESLPF